MTVNNQRLNQKKGFAHKINKTRLNTSPSETPMVKDITAESCLSTSTVLVLPRR